MEDDLPYIDWALRTTRKATTAGFADLYEDGVVRDSSAIGLEVFYNIAATNWLYVTPDIQAIEPADRRGDTAFITSLRLQTRF